MAVADTFKVPVTLHDAQPTIGTIAPLHFAASTPSCRYPQEFNIEPHPFARQLVYELLRVQKGYLTVPDTPCLSVAVNEGVIAELSQ